MVAGRWGVGFGSLVLIDEALGFFLVGIVGGRMENGLLLGVVLEGSDCDGLRLFVLVYRDSNGLVSQLSASWPSARLLEDMSGCLRVETSNAKLCARPVWSVVSNGSWFGMIRI